MYTLCWSAKGGSGTTVVASALAVLTARTQPTVVVDLGGDVAPALGVGTPTGPGLAEWWASPNAPPATLLPLAHEIGPGLGLIHPGDPHTDPVGGLVRHDVHAERLAAALACTDGHVVVDAGESVPPPTLHQCADQSLLVVRPCYLALRRAVRFTGLATGVIVVGEPGRALGTTEIERSLGLPVVAEIPWDPAVARAIDAGLLASRLPGSLARPLTRVVRAGVRGQLT